jgi:ABC-2 type transport system permease protein
MAVAFNSGSPRRPKDQAPAAGTAFNSGSPRRPKDQAPAAGTAFVRLKLRLIAGGLRGHAWRVVLFVLGVLFGATFAIIGYAVCAAPGLLGDARVAGMLLPLAGAAIVLGWLLLPLVFFGVDESLDPARFALLPLARGTLIRGMFAASLVGVPALATLVATMGMVHTAARLGGPVAAVVQLLGVLLGLLLCAAVSRAVTSAFATALRSRRARDVATMLLAVMAALLGPIQLLALAGLQRADWDRVADVAGAVGWTPLGAPYSVGLDVLAGRGWAVPVKLGVVGATIGLLLWWWSATLEHAMVGAATTAAGRSSTIRRGTPVAQLVLPFLPRNRAGALVSREARYWWRETRRRASLITFSVVGIFLPVTVAVTGGTAGGLLLFVGALAALGLANQFGYEGSAYAANVIAGVPGRVELHTRVAGYALYVVPLLVTIAIVVGAVAGRPAEIPALLGTLAAALGTGLAAVLPISVRGAYALPDTTNPFALSSGGGLAKGLMSLAALLAAVVGTVPIQVTAYLLGSAWLWAGLPVGVLYGSVAYLLGSRLAGNLLDRRMPELLAAVTPR